MIEKKLFNGLFALFSDTSNTTVIDCFVDLLEWQVIYAKSLTFKVVTNRMLIITQNNSTAIKKCL